MCKYPDCEASTTFIPVSGDHGNRIWETKRPTCVPNCRMITNPDELARQAREKSGGATSSLEPIAVDLNTGEKIYSVEIRRHA